MKIKHSSDIKTKKEAQQIAMDYQHWSSCQDLSYLEVSQWSEYFEVLAEKFNLEEEFKENGII